MESVVCSDVTADAPAFSKRPPVSNIYEIAGRFLLFASPDGDLPSHLSQLLKELYFNPAGNPVPDATISFQQCSFLPAIPEAHESFEVSDGGVCHTDGNTYLFDFDIGRVVINPSPSRRVDVLMRKELDLERAEHVKVFNYAISSALRRCGLYELHSAAVIEPGTQKGVLFAGPSGSGKSTLTLQFAAGGWQFLTDDVLLLKEANRIVEAEPLRRAFAVTDKTLSVSGHRRLREAVTTSDQFDGSKKRLAPRDIFPGGFAPACTPASIFFPVITHRTGSTVRELSRSEALIKLVRLCPWACYDRGTGSDHLRVLGTLAKQCQSFELLAGQDLLDNPERVSGLVIDKSVA